MQKNRTILFFRNSFTTAMYQVIVMIAGFIVPKMMLLYYGSEMNGLVSSVMQFIAYFSLVEAGIAGAAVYALYRPLAENNHIAVNGIMSAARSFYAKAGSLYLILLCVFAVIFPFFISTDQISSKSISILILILGGKGILDFFSAAKYNVILMADQKLYVVSIASAICVALQTIFIVTFAFLHASILIVYAIALFAWVTRNVILWIYVKRNYPHVLFYESVDSDCLKKRWDAFFLQILGVVQAGAPVIIATVFLSLKEVSVYAIFNIVFIGLSGILGIFISGLSVSFGDIIARKESELLKNTYNDFEFVYYIMIAVIFAVAMILIMPFIRVYTMGVYDVNYDVPMLGVLFVVNGLLYNLKTPQGMMVISAGHFRETRWRSAVQALIIIILGCLFASFGGLVGILVASCVSNIYRDIDLAYYIPRKVTGTPVKTSAFRMLQCIALFLVIATPVLLIDITPASLLGWVGYASLTLLYGFTFAMLLTFIFEKKQLFLVLNRLKTAIK